MARDFTLISHVIEHNILLKLVRNSFEDGKFNNIDRGTHVLRLNIS